MKVHGTLWAAACVIAILMAPAAAWSQCNQVPYDGTAETGFGAGAGYVMEYCTEIVVDPACTIEGWYWPVSQTTAFARQGGQTTLDYTAALREVDCASRKRGDPCEPGELISDGYVHVEGIPNFPSFTENLARLPSSRRLTETFFSCTRIVGDDSPGIFVTGDKSSTTPFTVVWGRVFPDGTWENLSDPLVRTLGQAGGVAPFRAELSGSFAVPPDLTTATAFANVTPGGQIWVDSVQDFSEAENAVHIEEGEGGVNGPPICQFSDIEFPFNAVCPGLDDYLIVDSNSQYTIYIEIQTTNRAVTEIIRGQIMPANLIFGDGFERATVDNWPFAVR